MKRRALILIAISVLFYFVSYLFFRNSRIEIWNKDQKAYVIFSKDQKWIYYLYRSLTYMDSKLTDMRFHIGPHQEQ